LGAGCGGSVLSKANIGAACLSKELAGSVHLHRQWEIFSTDQTSTYATHFERFIQDYAKEGLTRRGAR